jgi:hypothetical protein
MSNKAKPALESQQQSVRSMPLRPRICIIHPQAYIIIGSSLRDVSWGRSYPGSAPLGGENYYRRQLWGKLFSTFAVALFLVPVGIEDDKNQERRPHANYGNENARLD